MGQRSSSPSAGLPPSQEFKQIFDSCDKKKSGVLDVKESRKFLIKLYKANLFRTNPELKLDEYVSQMMERMEFDEKNGTLSWSDLHSFHRGSFLTTDDDKSEKKDRESSDCGEGSEFIALWQRFGCPMPSTPTLSIISPLSVASTFFRTSSTSISCFRYGFATPAPVSFSFAISSSLASTTPPSSPSRTVSSPPRSSSSYRSSSTNGRLSSSLPSPYAASSHTTFSTAVIPFVGSSDASTPSSVLPPCSFLASTAASTSSTNENIYRLLQYLLRQEPRYGSIPDDARDILNAFERQQIPLTLSSFVNKDGQAFDVMLKWKGEDGLRQRMLKMQDGELMKLVKLTASACERPLLYALNEDLRPGLDPYFPYVLQTEILQYILEKDTDCARLSLKQEIAQLLYLIVWRTEEPGLTQRQYSRLISLLETSVEAAREIKPDSYSRRPAVTDVLTGLQVFTPPSAEDELEMEKSQTRLLSLLCNIQCSLMQELQVETMNDARAQFPAPKPTELCPHCGYSKPASRDCRFRKKRRAAPVGSTKFDPNLTCLALSIFGVGTKSLLLGKSSSH